MNASHLQGLVGRYLAVARLPSAVWQVTRIRRNGDLVIQSTQTGRLSVASRVMIAQFIREQTVEILAQYVQPQ